MSSLSDLGDADRVRSISRIQDSYFSDVEIEDFLQEARNTAETLFSVPEIDEFLVGFDEKDSQNSLKRRYTLFFITYDVDEIRVFVNEEQLDSADFSYDDENREIIIDDGVSLSYRDWVRIYYKPKIFDDFVNFHAVFSALSSLPSSMKQNYMTPSFAQNKIDMIQRMIQKKPRIAHTDEHSSSANHMIFWR